MGALKHSSGDYTIAVLVLAAVMAGGAVFAFFMLPIISPDSTMRPPALSDAPASADFDAEAAKGSGGGSGSSDGGGSSGVYSSLGARAVAAQSEFQLAPLRSPC